MKKTPKEELHDLFNKNDWIRGKWGEKGVAFVWVDVFDKRGRRYGSAHHVLQKLLEGREYKVWRNHQGKLNIELLDTEYIPQNYLTLRPVWWLTPEDIKRRKHFITGKW